MPGVPYPDWTHVRVVGNRADAAQYLPFAKKMLGYVSQDAASRASKVSFLTRVLPDGAVVHAAMIGSIPQITITPPRGKKRQPADWLEGVVLVGAYRSGAPDVLIERFDEPKDGVQYAGYFYGKDGAGYAQAAFPKGSWKMVQPEVAMHTTNDALGELRDKLKKRTLLRENAYATYGNCLTHVNADGESVNWFGLELGNYFYVPNVIPARQGSLSVSHRGVELFNSFVNPKPGQPLEWFYMHVKGAAIRDKTLYVALADGDYYVTYTPPPTRLPPLGVFVAPASNPGPKRVLFLKIPLHTEFDKDTRHEYYRPGEPEVLFRGDVHNGDGPWVFDRDVTHAVCIARADENRLIWGAVDGHKIDEFNATNLLTPSTSHLRHVFTLEDQVLTTSDAGDVIAEDSGKQLRLERVGDADWDYVWENRRIPAIRIARAWLWRRLAYVDVQRGRFMFVVTECQSPGERFMEWIEIVDGDQAQTQIVDGPHHWRDMTSDGERRNFDSLRARVSQLNISSNALMHIYMVGPYSGVLDSTFYGTRREDFEDSQANPGWVKNKQWSEINFATAASGGSSPNPTDGRDWRFVNFTVVSPLLNTDINMKGALSSHADYTYGGVAYNTCVYPFVTGAEAHQRVHFYPSDLPQSITSLNYRVPNSALILIRGYAAASQDDWMLVRGSVFYQQRGGKEATVGNPRSALGAITVSYVTGGDLDAISGYPARGGWGAPYWGKPPKNQKREYTF